MDNFWEGFTKQAKVNYLKLFSEGSKAVKSTASKAKKSINNAVKATPDISNYAKNVTLSGVKKRMPYGLIN